MSRKGAPPPPGRMTVGDALAMPAGGGDEDEDEFDNSFGTWFRSFPGRSIYLHVPQAFFEDDFNLCEAQSLPNFDLLWDTILAEGCPGMARPLPSGLATCLPCFACANPLDDTVLDDEGLCEDFFRFYQVMHQRFILTRAGLQQMVRPARLSSFGRLLPVPPGGSIISLSCTMARPLAGAHGRCAWARLSFPWGGVRCPASTGCSSTARAARTLTRRRRGECRSSTAAALDRLFPTCSSCNSKTAYPRGPPSLRSASRTPRASLALRLAH